MSWKGDYFYVFEQVTVPSTETCDGGWENFGSGRLFAITTTLSAARSYVTEAAKTIVEAQEPTQATDSRQPPPDPPVQGIRRPLR